jgi:hypothetical protein
VWRYGRAVAGAFRKNEQGEPTQAARLWLAAILTPVSRGLLFGLVDEGSAQDDTTRGADDTELQAPTLHERDSRA